MKPDMPAPTCLVLNLTDRPAAALLADRLFPHANLEFPEIDEQEDQSENVNTAESPIWKIDNKYYTAAVRLLVAGKLEDLPKDEEAGHVEGLVIFAGMLDRAMSRGSPLEGLEGGQSNSLDRARALRAPFTRCETQLLVVDGFATEANREAATKWCLEEGIEIVDFSEDKVGEDKDEDEQHFFSCTASQRISEALQTCPWSNMEMKRRNGGNLVDQVQNGIENVPNGVDQVPNGVHQVRDGVDVKNGLENVPNGLEVPNGVGNAPNGLENVPTGVGNLPNDANQAAADSIGNAAAENDEEEDFEALFARFADFRDKAATLSGEERRNYAERVAMSFWDALGGDPQEVEGIDSD